MSCPAFISRSFAVRDAAHLAHLTTRSYAQHVALDGFYNGILDLIDKYAEVYMGLEGKTTKYPTVGAISYDDPVELLTDYLLLVRQEAREDEQESQALLNILAEMEELTAQSLYKLKFLK